MNGDQYSLSKLHDIVIPEPVSWWPLAPGGWVLICIAVVVIFVITWRFYRSWQSNAYRRAGLALLADAGTAHDISVILKRVSLAVFPREQVASLYGKEWIAFLNQTCSRCDLSSLLEEQAASETLINQSRTWILRHSAPSSLNLEPRTPNPEPQGLRSLGEGG